MIMKLEDKINLNVCIREIENEKPRHLKTKAKRCSQVNTRQKDSVLWQWRDHSLFLIFSLFAHFK